MKRLLKFSQFLNESSQPFKYNGMIDYTLLDNGASDQDIIDLCSKAKKFGTKSVCVMPKHVKVASECLKDSPVLVCTVVGFPGGDNDVEYKKRETEQVIRDGADEVDMVLNYNKLKDNFNTENHIQTVKELTNEVRSLVEICHRNNNKNSDSVILKVIVESGLLSIDETHVSTNICINAGADFIKTSTGKVSIGAEINKVKAMKQTINEDGGNMEIKVSGGVRTLEQIKEYESLGATRFGMGYGSVDTLNGLESKNEGY